MAVSTVLSVGPVERGQRLHRGPGDQQLAGGDAALDAAGQRGLPAVGAGLGVPGDRVVGLAAPPAGDLEAVADLDALDGLDRHEGAGEQRVELAVPVDVAAEPDGHAVGEDLDDAAEAVAVLGRRLDLGDHRLLGRGVEAADRRTRRSRRGRRGRAGRLAFGAGRAHLDHVAQDVDVELGQQRLGQRCRPRRAPPSPGPRPARGRRARR